MHPPTAHPHSGARNPPPPRCPHLKTSHKPAPRPPVPCHPLPRSTRWPGKLCAAHPRRNSGRPIPPLSGTRQAPISPRSRPTIWLEASHEVHIGNHRATVCLIPDTGRFLTGLPVRTSSFVNFNSAFCGRRPACERLSGERVLKRCLPATSRSSNPAQCPAVSALGALLSWGGGGIRGQTTSLCAQNWPPMSGLFSKIQYFSLRERNSSDVGGGGGGIGWVGQGPKFFSNRLSGSQHVAQHIICPAPPSATCFANIKAVFPLHAPAQLHTTQV